RAGATRGGSRRSRRSRRKSAAGTCLPLPEREGRGEGSATRTEVWGRTAVRPYGRLARLVALELDPLQHRLRHVVLRLGEPLLLPLDDVHDAEPLGPFEDAARGARRQRVERVAQLVAVALELGRADGL